MTHKFLTLNTASADDPIYFWKRIIQSQNFLLHIATTLLPTIPHQEDRLLISQLKIMESLITDLGPALSDPAIQNIPISFQAMYHNVNWTVDRLTSLILNDSREKAAALTEYQLIPFLQDWLEDTYFWTLIYPDKEKMKEYYETEFAENHKNTYNNRGEKYLISIMIPVFNKLEYTKRCLESLFRNTDLAKYPCELILLNDGSTDGTEEYFESLGITKVITLKQNVKTMIFSLLYRVCEGKYAAFVNNDTILTEHWLDNLLTCLQFYPNAVMSVPSTPNTSNRQGMIAEFTPENAEEVAKDHNRPCPYLWEERCRLMPVIALYDVEKVNTFGFADRYFHTMEFWDDDFSLRARRAGFQQILCLDTWCYHYGSISGKADQIKNRTLFNGRVLFQTKYGIDPWGNNFCYDPYQLSHIEPTIQQQPADVSMLAIDPGFGADVLKFKTQLRRREKKSSFSFLINDAGLKDDLNPFHSTVIVSPSILETHKHIPEGSYNYISLGKDLSVYPDYKELLKECSALLRTGGFIYFYVSNPYAYHLKRELSEERILNGKASLTLINIQELLPILNSLNLKPQLRAILETAPPSEQKGGYTEHLDRYFLICEKQS
nr:glycosyltransferase [uncultured Clostridium sp.]